jgi:hypothetical protein
MFIVLNKENKVIATSSKEVNEDDLKTRNEYSMKIDETKVSFKIGDIYDKVTNTFITQ